MTSRPAGGFGLDGCRRPGVHSASFSNVCSTESDRSRQAAMSKRYDEDVHVQVERDAGMPAVFVWRGRRYEVTDVIGKWRIEGRWWSDGRDREYWRVEARGGAVWDLYHDRQRGACHMKALGAKPKQNRSGCNPPPPPPGSG